MSLKLAALAAILLTTSGCIGIYDNSQHFTMPPKEGSTELEMLQTYGKPAYAGFAEDKKVYIYEVRNNRYIVLVGVYEGHDLVVTCEGGVVSEVKRLDQADKFALFNPLPWAETY